MDRLNDGPSRLTYSFGLSTINSRYVVHACRDGVLIKDLDTSEGFEWHLEDAFSRQRSRLLLQLCSIKTDWLAISCGSQTTVRNICNWKIVHKIQGNGRTVTALAWSRHDPNLLALGTIDGSITIWSLSTHPKLLRRFKKDIPCRIISFSPHNDDVLATSHHESVFVWSLCQRPNPMVSLAPTHGTIIALAWHPVTVGALLATTACGDAILWQVSLTDLLSDSSSDDAEHIGLLGDLDGTGRIAKSATGRCIHSNITYAAWTRKEGVLVLTRDGREVAFLELAPDTWTTRTIATIALDHNTHALDLWRSYGRLIATTYSPGHVQTHEIPTTIVEHMLVSPGKNDRKAHSASNKDFAVASDDILPHEDTLARIFSSHMRPVPISQEPENQSDTEHSEVRDSRGLNYSTAHHRDSKRRLLPETSVSDCTVPLGMMSSLELPTARMDEVSPMPFLSPSIPARKSPATLGVEEGLHIPLLPESSLGFFTSTAEHDSDSDDETFAAGMSGSGTLMPGGVNVPLPKMCGALFAPGGQLVVFLRPKQLLSPSQLEQIRDIPAKQPVGHVEMSKLFPSFSNLIAPINITVPGSVHLVSTDTDRPVSKVAFNASSLPSHLVRQLGALPTRTESISLEDTQAVDLRIYDLANLLQTDREVGRECRISCESNESRADLCRHNAKITNEAGFTDAADIWRLLAMLLEDSITLRTIYRASTAESIVAVAREASITGDTVDESGGQNFPSKLRWAEHPFGSAWLVQRILCWAEQRADLHMLANISAMLCQSDEKSLDTSAVIQQALSTNLPSLSEDFSVEAERWPLSQRIFQSVPVLEKTSNSSNALEESPIKIRQSSVASSRNASSPSTPFLDSGSSTPPFIFPGFSRQGSRLSASGSASPEHHRSSFSAAAKYYAQSITDKISSYGSSPPLKRTGTSPGTNEFSNSLPAGSWSKSVSFASATSTTKDSQLSRSYTAGEDGYDSDKTIDEASLPQTPRSNQGEVTVKLKGAGQFTDERSGGAKSPLISDTLVTKAGIWRQQYAEQLRVWGHWIQATELEKVSRLSIGMPVHGVSHEGPMLAQISGQRQSTCTICLSLVQGLQQACPLCLHTTHLACLVEYVQMFGKEQFACPAGCDCDCAALSSGPTGIPGPDLTSQIPTMMSQVKI